jgi:glycosyltransferase involved in cell wall biosynthesis
VLRPDLNLSQLDPARCGDRILVVTGSLAVGGTEMHLARVLPGLVKRGWEVTVFALTGEGPLAKPLRDGGVQVVSLGWGEPIHGNRALPQRLLRLAMVSVGLVRAMRRLKPTITHFFLPEAYIVGAVCARVAGLGNLAMSRRSLNLYQAKRPGIGRIERALHRRMSVVLGNSGAVVRELREEGIGLDRLALIYNGLAQPAAALDRAATRRALGVPDEALTIAIVANLIPYKGHLDLVEALGRAAPDLPDWRLLCIGRDDGHGPTLREAAARAGIADRIQWLGPRHDVDALLGAADIGVLASHEEGFSNALLEGMAAALPMIATSVGGNPEAVVEGETGLLVPPRAPERLADAIRALGCDPARRAAMGAAARRRVEERFSLERCIADYDRLYTALSCGARAPVAADFTLVAEAT